MKINRLYNHELDYINNPEKYTYEFFKNKYLKDISTNAALGIADEELLNYYENKINGDGRFILKMEPNSDNYILLEKYVLDSARKIAGDYLDENELKEYDKYFEIFRKNIIISLYPFPEYQKKQMLKKISAICNLNPYITDEIFSMFFSCSTMFSLELFSFLLKDGKMHEFLKYISLPETEIDLLSKKPLLMMPPWNHQKNALNAWLKTGGRGVLEMATATGKTYVGLCAIHRLFTVNKKLNVLIITNSRALLNQWRREAIDKLGLYADPKQDFTNPLKYVNKNYSLSIEFKTIQSVYKNPKKYPADLLIVDEVHHIAGKEFQKALLIPCKWKMGLSATVEGYERHDVIDRYLGNTVFRYSLKKAKDDGIIPDFRLVVHKSFLDTDENNEFSKITRDIKKLLTIINSEYKDTIFTITGNYNSFKNLGEFISLMRKARYKGYSLPDDFYRLMGLLFKRRMIIHKSHPKMQSAISLAKIEGKSKKCVLFTMDIATCEKIYSDIKDFVPAFRVHSNLKESKRNHALDEFRKSRTGVLVAPKVLDEGIDVPDAEIGINVASAKTKLQLIQRMGRILRNKPGKKPVFHHYVAIPSDCIEEEDSFTLQNDLSWILDLSLKSGIIAELKETKLSDLANLEKHFEDYTLDYYRERKEIFTEEYGTIKIKNIIQSIDGNTRKIIVNALQKSKNKINEQEWYDIINSSGSCSKEINYPALRWIWILSEKDRTKLINYFNHSKNQNEEPGYESLSHGEIIQGIENIGINESKKSDSNKKTESIGKKIKYAKSKRERESAASELLKFGSESKNVLSHLLTDKNSETKICALKLAGEICDPSLFDLIINCLSEKDHDVKIAAADSLSEYKDKRANYHLMKAGRVKDPEVKKAVKKALTKINKNK
ncbi:hypothetical protein F1737_04230 [Methanoplanus sp. FWC-SCC4]|uniref:Uncharacterized protein n=1 Tax=Methanochimaera problematica TaxID=2609417 RepID=A0AA97FD12_9EURY|nr:DEAD/DEAH box helicase family protein [Methanoplanus sp. FWC-SCC4]WOF15963.1 hypothetical protein F1737_04230 [Methanoplanus sp. FWC-SCC4]